VGVSNLGAGRSPKDLWKANETREPQGHRPGPLTKEPAAAPLPAFILQPLVENAILHGFEERETGGIISVVGKAVGEAVYLTVRDNGAGLPPDKLMLIHAQLDDLSPVRSIGLVNVHKRLRLHYGEPYGLKIDSVQGLGTSVQVQFPILNNIDKMAKHSP